MNPKKFTKYIHLLILTAFFITMLFSACEEEGSKQRWYMPEEKKPKELTVADSGAMWGNWVCRDFIELADAKKSVRGVRHRPFFIEMVFRPEYGDSVLLINAYEDFFAHWEKNANNEIIIKNILPDKNIVLYAPPGLTEIMLADTLEAGGKGQVHNWIFIKAQQDYIINDGNYPAAIPGYINNSIIEGDYLPANGGTGIPITFETNGVVHGWPLYDRYRICLGGGCYRLTKTPFDIIQLTGMRNNDYYGLVVSPNADSVNLYRLVNGAPGKDYSYGPGGLAYALKKLPK